MKRMLLAMFAVAALTGCPEFIVNRGAFVTPSATLAMPAPADLPAASTYISLEDTWRRDAGLGVGGYVFATLWDPVLAAAEVAHDGALMNVPPSGMGDRLKDRWDELYGAERDRFPIDVRLQFDAQFYSDPAILSPGSWTFQLSVAGGPTYPPLENAVISRSPTPKDGYWTGDIRLWFPWRDPDTRLLLLGHQTTAVTLLIAGDTGKAKLTWRFRSAYADR